MTHGVIRMMNEEGVSVVGTAPAQAIEHALSLLVSELGDAAAGLLGEEDIGARLDRLEAFALVVAARLDDLAGNG